MININFLDRKGNPVFGKIPTLTWVEGVITEDRIHAAQAFYNQFCAVAAQSVAPSLSDSITLADGTTIAT